MMLLLGSGDDAVCLSDLPVVAAVLALFCLAFAWPLRWLRPSAAVAVCVIGLSTVIVEGRSSLYALVVAVAVPSLLAMLRRTRSASPWALRSVISRGAPVTVGVLLTLALRNAEYGLAFFAGALAYLGADLATTEAGILLTDRRRAALTGALPEPRAAVLDTLLGLVAGIVGAALPTYVWSEAVITLSSPMPLGVQMFIVVGLAGLLCDRVVCASLRVCRHVHWPENALGPQGADECPLQARDARSPAKDMVSLVVGLLAGLLGIAAVRIVY